MKKVKLEIVGLSYSQTQTGAYALVLGETKDNKRRLPIIIGGFEAQAIAIELEKMTPSRPLTHDLFKSFAEGFEITIDEVIIYNLVDGIFYARLVCNNELGKTVEIDARTSDAIALAVRFNCPINTYEFILAKAGILLDDDATTTKELPADDNMMEMEETSLLKKSTEELQQLLEKSLHDEDYEHASKIRDELNNRKKS